MRRGQGRYNDTIAIAALVVAVLLSAVTWIAFYKPIVLDLVAGNSAALIGLPAAFMGAFLAVVIIRQGAGPIEFNCFGMQFNGLAGEVVLQAICFVAIADSIKLLRPVG
ncbi:hypothetical protein [Marinivivus vitaminiproducens]|uniref:hypothetical protein n=1 Tax=Marinivivus vitaminiproducens TaxID=3035935 RepID=UPI0027A0E6FF|nr:hypothetical protein P4R82_10095 [Geminicoccaceae bacterium SCSIO 64248]